MVVGTVNEEFPTSVTRAGACTQPDAFKSPCPREEGRLIVLPGSHREMGQSWAAIGREEIQSVPFGLDC